MVKLYTINGPHVQQAPHMQQLALWAHFVLLSSEKITVYTNILPTSPCQIPGITDDFCLVKKWKSAVATDPFSRPNLARATSLSSRQLQHNILAFSEKFETLQIY